MTEIAGGGPEGFGESPKAVGDIGLEGFGRASRGRNYRNKTEKR